MKKQHGDYRYQASATPEDATEEEERNPLMSIPKPIMYTTEPETKKSTPAVFKPAYSLYVLMIIVGISLYSFSTRTIYSMINPYLKKQLPLTDSQYSLLVGPVYSVLYSVAGIICGRLADKFSRKWLVSISLFLNAVVTGVTGLCRTFWHILACRMLLALAQSGTTGILPPLIADYFPTQYRSTVMSLYTWSLYLGFGISYALGAIENSENTDSQLWRYELYVMAAPGVILSLLMLLTVKEPKRGQFDFTQTVDPQTSRATAPSLNADEEAIEEETVKAPRQQQSNIELRQSAGFFETIKYLLCRPTFYIVTIAGSIRYLAGSGLIYVLPTFYNKLHHFNSTEQAKYLSWILPFGGLIGVLIGGVYTDRWSKQDKRAKTYIAFISCFMSVPFSFFVCMVDQAIPSMLFLIPTMAFAEMWGGPASATIVDIAPACMRSVSYAAYYFISSCAGSFGALLITSLEPTTGLRMAMMIGLSASYGVAAFWFFVSAHVVERDIEAKSKWELQNRTDAPPVPSEDLP